MRCQACNKEMAGSDWQFDRRIGDYDPLCAVCRASAFDAMNELVDKEKMEDEQILKELQEQRQSHTREGD